MRETDPDKSLPAARCEMDPGAGIGKAGLGQASAGALSAPECSLSIQTIQRADHFSLPPSAPQDPNGSSQREFRPSEVFCSA